MIKVGLTGNMGSGKSIVAGVFSVLGVPVYHSDEESRKFLKDPGVINKIKTQFGQNVFLSAGEIDRSALAEIVFADDKALAYLDSILHPLVLTDFIKWSENFPKSPYVIQESAIIIEIGAGGLFDRIIHVSCPKEIAVDRAMKRDGIDRKSVLQRMRFQMEDEEKATLSDFVINNDGTEMIIPQVLTLHRRLLEIGILRNY